MANELVQVEFHGDLIEAAVGEDGKILVGFRQLCRLMEQDYETQLTKLRSRSRATVTHVERMTPQRRVRLTTAIDLKTLRGWLLSINENRVPDEVRPKLIRYQAECVEVLERHFLRRAAPTRYRPWAERFRESFSPHSQTVIANFPEGSFTVITEGGDDHANGGVPQGGRGEVRPNGRVAGRQATGRPEGREGKATEECKGTEGTSTDSR